jgi:hypothetical protein
MAKRKGRRGRVVPLRDAAQPAIKRHGCLHNYRIGCPLGLAEFRAADLVVASPVHSHGAAKRPALQALRRGTAHPPRVPGSGRSGVACARSADFATLAPRVGSAHARFRCGVVGASTLFPRNERPGRQLQPPRRYLLAVFDDVCFDAIRGSPGAHIGTNLTRPRVGWRVRNRHVVQRPQERASR